LALQVLAGGGDPRVPQQRARRGSRFCRHGRDRTGSPRHDGVAEQGFWDDLRNGRRTGIPRTAPVLPRPAPLFQIQETGTLPIAAGGPQSRKSEAPLYRRLAKSLYGIATRLP
jgi:hypothetical protein